MNTRSAVLMAIGLLPQVLCAQTVIDFETIPNGASIDQLEISTQWAAALGVRFALSDGTLPELAEVGLPRTAFAPTDSPADPELIGQFFLTDDGGLSGSNPPAVVVSYDFPTDEVAGVILDMDFDESFTVTAYDDAGGVVGTVTITAGDPGTGDAEATPFRIQSTISNIYRLELQGSKPTGNFGLGFDNFEARALPSADLTTTSANPGEPGYGEPDGVVDGADLAYYVERWLALDPEADLTTTSTNPGDFAFGDADGTVDGADLSFFVERWLLGVP